ncbi:MAG: trypsin-like peptidase domain-containing protein, partial [Planctomycetota bacterium]|nr:trypsin-like peptidase domain-containing protein [Planctomycetota bacterium]
MTRPDYNATRRFVGLLVLSMFCSLTAIHSAQAQFAPIPTPEERAKMYDTLAEDVAHLEQTVAVLKKVVHLVKPTVVHIEAAKPDEVSGRVRNSIEEAGSGTLIEYKDKFYVITNRHVIEGAEAQNIRLKLADGRILNPTKIWGDPGTDIAVMAIKAEHLIPARIGNSDKLDIGDFVLAVGSPFAQSHSFTFGIVSAKGRRGLELGKGVDYQD